MDQDKASRTKGSVLRWIASITAYCAAIAIFLAYANYLYTWDTYTYGPAYKLDTITRVNGSVHSAIGIGSLMTAVVLVVVCVLSFKWRLLRLPVIGILIAAILYPFALLYTTVHNLGPWTVYGQVRGDDGTEYVFLDSSFLQGQTMAIAAVARRDRFTTTYQVLVHNNGDSPRSWASLVRPAGSSDEYGQLYLTEDQLLVGVRGGNHCYLAYDLNHGIAMGHGDIESLSPFVCLSDGDAINMADVPRTISRLTDYTRMCISNDYRQSAEAMLRGEPAPGCPPLQALRDGLDSDNPALVEAATSLLRSYEANAQLLRDYLAQPEHAHNE